MKNSLVVLLFSILSVSVVAADDDCKDTSDHCAGWEKQGFCENCFYKCDVRIQYCAKTCGYCGDDKAKCKDCTVTTVSTTPAPSTTTTMASTTTGPCFDMVDSCKNWSVKGFCTNPFYKCVDRLKYCPKTCGLCSPGACANQ